MTMSDQIEAIRERANNPDPDMVLDIEGLYDDASADRSTLLAALDEATRLIVHDHDGVVVTQGAFNHYEDAYESALRRIRELEVERDTIQREWDKWVNTNRGWITERARVLAERDALAARVERLGDVLGKCLDQLSHSALKEDRDGR